MPAVQSAAMPPGMRVPYHHHVTTAYMRPLTHRSSAPCSQGHHSKRLLPRSPWRRGHLPGCRGSPQRSAAQRECMREAAHGQGWVRTSSIKTAGKLDSASVMQAMRIATMHAVTIHLCLPLDAVTASFTGRMGAQGHRDTAKPPTRSAV